MNEPSKATISAVMSHLGRKGGVKGGKALAASMSAAERIERARKAGRASGLARKKKAAAREAAEIVGRNG